MPSPSQDGAHFHPSKEDPTTAVQCFCPEMPVRLSISDLSGSWNRGLNCVLSIFKCRGLPGGPVVSNPPVNAGNTGSIPGLGRYHMPRRN